jgi:hypothetical protein
MKRSAGSTRMFQSLLLCMGIVFAVSVPLMRGRPVVAEARVTTERTFTLPCEATSFVQSGDSGIIWFACTDQSLRKRWEMEAAEAHKNKIAPPPPPVTSHARTDVYALETTSGRVTALASAEGRIELAAAPVGNEMILVLPQEKGRGSPVLYEGFRKKKDLQIDASFLVWSADASKIYFYGGSTIQADAWSILGVLRLSDFTVSRNRLLEATESVHVCSTDGHIFTGNPIPNRQGELQASAVEYDADAKFLRRVPRFLPGNFSAGCRYVATEQSFHGPLPWEIIEVATGKQLMNFDYTGEGKKEEFEFGSWNPKRDGIFVRIAVQPSKSETGATDKVVQVFNLSERIVLRSFNDISGQFAWSKDGQDLIFFARELRNISLRP